MKRAGADVDEMLRYMRAMALYTRATLLLQAAAMSDPEEVPKVEVLLHRAGLEIGEIAKLLGKTYIAVAKTISRDRLSRTRGL